jgi:GT2 family glycosyltransferase
VILVAQRPIDEGTRRLADTAIDLPAPIGFAAAVNRGLLEAKAEFVALVNDDAVVETGWVGPLLEQFAHHADLASVQGLNRLPGDRIDGCGIAWNSDWQATQIGHGQQRAAEPAPGEIFGVSATAALYRREALSRCATDHGILDARLESFYEDVDLAARLRAAGFRASFVPGARALHQGSLTTGKDPFRKWFLLTRNRRWVVARLLGRDFAGARATVDRRDRRDGLGALSRLDFARLRGIREGRRAATERLREFAHDGEPLVSRRVLAAFGAPGR